MLGRSTAKNSLLIWTQSLQNTTFTDSFLINGENKGSAVTVGPGVPLNRVYAESKKLGKFVVGGTAASVAPAGGYVQGGGHSAFSPIYGLVADIVLRACSFYLRDALLSNSICHCRVQDRHSQWDSPHCRLYNQL